MKNITQSGYETITVVRSQYEPTTGQCLTISPVLWIYENPHTKEKKYFLVLASNNCVNYIFEFKDIPEPELLKLITQCGEVTPNENGEIIHTGECGARIVADGCKDFCINVRTSWGIAGGKIVCAGESIDLSLKPEETNIVTSNITDAKDGDSVVLDGDSGKVLKKAQQWRIGDTENSWTGRFDPETKNLNIFPDDKATAPMLTMLPSGVILTPYPTQCSAKLSKTPVFPANADFETGSNLPFVKIRDEDGYNKNANNFFPGDGEGKYAYYIAPYTGRYFIKYQFLIAYGTGTPPSYYAKVLWGQGTENSTFIRDVFNSTDNKTISDSGILFLNKGDKVHINIHVKGGSPFINVIAPKAIENYWEMVFLG